MLSEESGIPFMVCLNLSQLAAVEGALALDRAVARARVVEAMAPGVGLQVDAVLCKASRATVALAAGRIDDVIELLEHVRAECSENHTRWILWEADLIEAYARSGRVHDAEELLSSFENAARRAEHGEAIAVAATCRALLAEDDADEAYAHALALMGAGPWPLALARCELLYGERLRRSGHRAAARTHLRQALSTFEELGAVGFADRARQELKATGETVRRSSPDTRDELTPQERQIATLVANGATNREVAAGVFLSTKTVEKHLSSVYRKLGVRSRTELARLLADR